MTTSRSRRTLSAARFKARSLALLDEVNTSRETLIVTKRGRPVAKLVPVNSPHRPRSLRGSVRVLGDILGPIDVTWTANG